MAGFPTRTSRTAFGPTKQNATSGLIHPAFYSGAVETNLDYWQTSGCSVATARAWAMVTWDGATAVSLTASGEAWDPNSSYVPAVARSAQGVYTVTYLASYPDETATEVATNLLAATVSPQSTSSRHATYAITSGRIITVYMWDAAGAAADASFTVTAY